ncbi:MAG TPA: amidase, partial [Chloroflexota bacterium]|nr:amidase [Chloroflexota bacterium]
MAYRPLHLVAEARRIAAGETTSAALVESCLAQAAAVEPWLKCFTWLDPDRARRWAAESRPPDGGSPASRVPRPASTTNSDPGARSRAARNSELLLCGIPLGIKDIIDTAGIPTEHGSALFRGRVPERSAPVVQALEGAGAIVLGKTVTAEMAYFHPGPTRNPWNPARTPGGSSMGSAAAVAAGIVPGAVGTQTNGSVIRPAAFCGVVGFKPSAGRISRTGVLCFSHTLDQLGAFASTVEGVAWLAAAMGGEAMDAWWPGPAAGHDGDD